MKQETLFRFRLPVTEVLDSNLLITGTIFTSNHAALLALHVHQKVEVTNNYIQHMRHTIQLTVRIYIFE